MSNLAGSDFQKTMTFSIYVSVTSIAKCKRDATPLLIHWICVSVPLSYHYDNETLIDISHLLCMHTSYNKDTIPEQYTAPGYQQDIAPVCTALFVQGYS